MECDQDPCNKLQQLFLACDTRGSGYIGRQELRQLCQSFDISADDSDIIFDDLDQDRDGWLNFEDFCKGFRDCINPDFAVVSRKGSGPTLDETTTLGGTTADQGNVRQKGKRPRRNMRRRDSIHHAFVQFSKTYGEENVLQYLGNSEDDIQQLYLQLQEPDTDPGLRQQVEHVLGSLINEVQQLHGENKQMELVFIRERESNEGRLRLLEEELEAQMARADARARSQAEQQKQQELSQLENKMKEEIAELQMHLRMFQKVDGWLQKEAGQESHDTEETTERLMKTTQENRELKMNLTETEAQVALMRAEMTQIRSQYEDKCKELHSERAQLEEYVLRQQQLQRQSQVLNEVNRRIEGTNTSLRSSLQRHASRQHSDANDDGGDADSRERAQFGVSRLLQDLGVTLYLPGGQAADRLVQMALTLTRPVGPETSVCRWRPRAAASTRTSTNSTWPADDHEMLLQTSVYQSKTQLSPRGLPRRHPRLRRASPLPSPDLDTPPEPTAPLIHGHRLPLKQPPETSMLTAHEATGPADRTFKVVFAGDAAVGKSSFISRVCRGTFVTNLSSTLGVDFQVKMLCVDGKNLAIQLWDTAGQERFRSITKSYFRRADGVLLLYDISSHRSFLNVRQWVNDIDSVTGSLAPIMLCGSKCDLRGTLEANGQVCLSREQGETLARQFGAFFHETSAKTGEGMMEAIVELGRRMLTNEDVEVQTSALKVADDARKQGACSGANSPAGCKKVTTRMLA